MPSTENYLIYFILVTVLVPVVYMPFFYIVPKKFNLGWIVSTMGLLQIVISIYIFIYVYQQTSFHRSWSWFMLPHNLSVQLGIYVDLLSASLLVMVALISWIMTLYTIAYLPPYANTKRYFSLYNLSLTAMLWILVADNLWGMLVGWELLSISSCLLMGFWYQAHDATQASTYAWNISKWGSICFLIGILLLIIELGSCDIFTLAHLPSSAINHLSNNIILAGGCFIAATFTKSAQFPFFSWLPQAMVAPTPLSALLHTATVLGAGIYLLVRIQPILSFELNALLVITGHLTAFMGAAAALRQQHMKRMLAYSTLSQLGYVVAAIGLGAASIGISYLIIHAFAKACLFLIAGVIAQFLQKNGISKENAYILSNMKGMLSRFPLLAISYLAATVGLGIVPGLMGWRIKESILAQTFVWAIHTPGNYLHYHTLLLALVTSGLTICYMGRAFVHLFLGIPSWRKASLFSLSVPASYQSLWLMQGSVVICTIFLLLVSYLLNYFFIFAPVSDEGTWQPIVESISYGLLLLVIILWLIIHNLKSAKWVANTIWSSYNRQVLVVSGLPKTHVEEKSTLPLCILAMTFFKLFGQVISNISLFLHQLFLQGWYLDTCANFLAKQALACSMLARKIEEWLIDGLINKFTHAYITIAHVVHRLDDQLIGGIAHEVAILSQESSKLYLHLQSGRTQLYALWTCIGMGILLVIWMILS